MEVKLIGCPFCGGKAEVERTGNGRQSSIVACTNCGGRLESNEREWNTGHFWNQRFDVSGSPDTVVVFRFKSQEAAKRFRETLIEAAMLLEAAAQCGTVVDPIPDA